MPWDTATHKIITATRLQLSSPDVVYQALEEYGAVLLEEGSPIFSRSDASMERALVERNDRLIDLALAKNASSYEVVAQLYDRALQSTSDPGYFKAIRLACLSNRVVVGQIFPKELSGISPTEFGRLAMEGDPDEIAVLMRNPGRRFVLRDVYERRAPIADLTPDRWFLLVRSSIGNTGLNEDTSNEHGPDLLAWDIQKALFNLVCTAPVEPHWLYALHELLLAVDPSKTRSADNAGSVQGALDRWKVLRIEKSFSTQPEEQEVGFYTELSLVDEFRCLIAALYGRILAKGKFECIGEVDDPDVVLRCAHYGRGDLTVQEMRAAHQRDGEVFVFAGLMNDNLLLKAELRLELEQMLGGDAQRRYARRCEQLKQRYRWFDAKPLSDSLIEEELSEAPEPADAAAVKALAKQVESLQIGIAGVSRLLFWGLFIIGLAVLWRR